MSDLHPVVRRTQDVSGELLEHLLETRDRLDATQSGLRNKDGDIAIQVDSGGKLISVWLKEGTIDRRTPAQIAQEINTLLDSAGVDAEKAARELMHESIQAGLEITKKLPEESEFFPTFPAP